MEIKKKPIHNLPLIILDLDNTLIFSSDIKLDDQELLTTVTGKYKFYYVYKRPHVHNFLDFCFSKFDVAVWTAADSKYADHIIMNLFNDKVLRLKFVYTRERCRFRVNIDNVNDEFSTDTYAIKDLKKVTKRMFNGYRYHRSRILIIDDDPMSFSKNYGNGICIPSYTGEKHDTYLLSLIGLLIIILSENTDWRKINKFI
jgi:carboxy-terminal domain RNA polymerase II polypeptide A small phosphatase